MTKSGSTYTSDATKSRIHIKQDRRNKVRRRQRQHQHTTTTTTTTTQRRRQHTMMTTTYIDGTTTHDVNNNTTTMTSTHNEDDDNNKKATTTTTQQLVRSSTDRPTGPPSPQICVSLLQFWMTLTVVAGLMWVHFLNKADFQPDCISCWRLGMFSVCLHITHC